MAARRVKNGSAWQSWSVYSNSSILRFARLRWFSDCMQHFDTLACNTAHWQESARPIILPLLRIGAASLPRRLICPGQGQHAGTQDMTYIMSRQQSTDVVAFSRHLLSPVSRSACKCNTSFPSTHFSGRQGLSSHQSTSRYLTSGHISYPTSLGIARHRTQSQLVLASSGHVDTIPLQRPRSSSQSQLTTPRPITTTHAHHITPEQQNHHSTANLTSLLNTSGSE